MLAEVLNSSSVQRLMGIIRSRYGKGLKVVSLVDTRNIDAMTSHSPSLIEGDLRIPIIVNQQYFATAVVPEAEALSKEEQTALGVLVRMVLEPACYSLFLNWKMQNVEWDHNTERDNVIPINQFSFIEEVESEQAPIKILETGLVFLESLSPFTINKIAFEIHDMSQRWAYLPFKQIQNNIKNAADIKELGLITLYIEDVLQLTLADQKVISDFSKSVNLSQEPLVIIGSTTKIESLESHQMVGRDLLPLLAANRIEIDRLPKDWGLLRQSLELFLEEAVEI